MGFGEFSIGGGGAGGITVTAHAQDRWEERVPSSAGRLTAKTWLNAKPVIAPEADCYQARVAEIRGGRDMLLCSQMNEDRGEVIATVLYVDYDRLA